jgi:hypothetical protein
VKWAGKGFLGVYIGAAEPTLYGFLRTNPCPGFVRVKIVLENKQSSVWLVIWVEKGTGTGEWEMGNEGGYEDGQGWRPSRTTVDRGPLTGSTFTQC